MESRGGEKRAWRRKYPQTEDARLRSGCTGPVSDVVSAFRGPPRRHVEKGLGAKTRAWQPLLVNEDRGSLCNLCNRSRERSERRRHALRFSFLNASSADPRCRFLSSPLRYPRYRLSFYSLSLSVSRCFARIEEERKSTVSRPPRSINPFEKLAESESSPMEYPLSTPE